MSRTLWGVEIIVYYTTAFFALLTIALASRSRSPLGIVHFVQSQRRALVLAVLLVVAGQVAVKFVGSAHPPPIVPRASTRAVTREMAIAEPPGRVVDVMDVDEEASSESLQAIANAIAAPYRSAILVQPGTSMPLAVSVAVLFLGAAASTPVTVGMGTLVISYVATCRVAMAPDEPFALVDAAVIARFAAGDNPLARFASVRSYFSVLEAISLALLLSVVLFVAVRDGQARRHGFARGLLSTVHASQMRAILLTVVPEAIGDELVIDPDTVFSPVDLGLVSVMFVKVTGVSSLSESGIKVLDSIFAAFDELLDSTRGAKLMKLESVGSIYLVTAGVSLIHGESVVPPEKAASKLVALGFAMLQLTEGRTFRGTSCRLVIGVSSGPAIGHVLGTAKPKFSIVGDVTNVASRMMSKSEPGRITVSIATKHLLDECATPWTMIDRGYLDIKGKGTMHLHYVTTSRSHLRRALGHSHALYQKATGSASGAGSGLVAVARITPEAVASVYARTLMDDPEVALRLRQRRRRLRGSRAGASSSSARKWSISTSASTSSTSDPTATPPAPSSPRSRLTASTSSPTSARFGSFSRRAKKAVRSIVVDGVSMAQADGELEPLEAPEVQRVSPFESTRSLLTFFTAVAFATCTLDLIWAAALSPSVVGMSIEDIVTAWLVRVVPASLVALTVPCAGDWPRYRFIALFTLDVSFSAGTVLMWAWCTAPEVGDLLLLTNSATLFVANVAFVWLPTTWYALGVLAHTLFILFATQIRTSPYPTDASVLVALCVIGAFCTIAASRLRATVARNDALQQIGDDMHVRFSDTLATLLPPVVVQRFLLGFPPHTVHYNQVTVLSSDLVGFTYLTSLLSPMDTCHLLHAIYLRFDQLLLEKRAYKVEVIGDAYLAVTGMDPHASSVAAAYDAVDLALQLNEALRAVGREVLEPELQPLLNMRIGVHTEDAFGAIVGTQRVRYHLFGPCMAKAEQLEQRGIPGHTVVSRETRDMLRRGGYGYFSFRPVPNVANAFVVSTME